MQKLRKINLVISLYVSIGTILILLLMLLTKLNLSVIYGSSLIILIVLCLYSLKNTIRIWKLNKKNKLKLVFQSLLIILILVLTFVILLLE